MIPLPTIQSKGKTNTNTVSNIGNMFSNRGSGVMSSFQRKPPAIRKKRIARPESSSLAEKLERTVQKETQGLDYQFAKKAFDIYLNLANNIRKTINDLIQKVKLILGIEKEGSSQIRGQTTTPVPQQTTEQIRETAEAQEAQVSLQTNQNKTLIDIKIVLEKILKKIGTGGTGGGGGGILETAANTAMIASAVRGLGGRGIGTRLGGIAKAGKLGALAKVRNASAPVKFAASASDKTVRAVDATKSAITGTASKIGSKALSILGFGTALKGTGATASTASATANVVPKITNIPGQGYVLQPPSPVAPPTAPVAQAAQVAKPGFFGKIVQTAKNIGSGAVGMVQQLGKGGLELAKAIKNPAAFMKGPGKSVILPALKRIPILGSAIEGVIGYLNIPQIQQDPNLTPEQKKEAIGSELGKRFGSLVGSSIGAAVGLVGGPLGAVLGGLVGSFGGEYVGELIANALGPKEIYEFAASLPGIGSFFQNGVEATPKTEGQVAVETPSLQQAMTAPSASVIAQPSTAGFASASRPQLSPLPQTETGESIRYQTEQSINNQINAAGATGATDNKPVIINNYYNNSKTSMMGGRGTPDILTDGNALPPDDSGMHALLTRDLGRNAALGTQG